MAARRKKPLAVFEHGTRIYAPSDSNPHYRVVATDPVSGRRTELTATVEDKARCRARELEGRIASAVDLHDAAKRPTSSYARLREMPSATAASSTVIVNRSICTLVPPGSFPTPALGRLHGRAVATDQSETLVPARSSHKPY